ncbi:hypothetical protein [Parvicella tangerina]|uniref:Uncharacterized protein n=1 Tax=Parvicella tangerina TaxID=2829795 RepID=A0A916NTE0_9FLAO|nr:hypothetical protein [Parvicella tangerina]CAG5085725.1 hypothetical protein CRYO30217_02855 [Parvicella tangerina]
MIRIVLLVAIWLLLFSCDNSRNTSKPIDQEVKSDSLDKIEIVQAIIEKANKSSPKPPPAPLLRWPYESDEAYEFRKDSLIDSYRASWDTTTFVFVVEGKQYPIKYQHVERFLDDTFLLDSTDVVFNDSSDFFDVSKIREEGFVIVDSENAYAKDQDSLQDLAKRDDFNSLLSFSKMIFNRDRTKVIFLLNQYCGLYCGSGTLYKMAKSDEGWVVEAAEMEWGG